MVNSKAIRVIGEIFGMKTRSYHSLPLALTQDQPGQHARQKRDPQSR